MKTEIDVSNPQHVLRPGMYADVTLDLETQLHALIYDALEKEIQRLKSAMANLSELQVRA
jgi:hypothetical protein